MGHLSPAITLAHYTHVIDLLQFEAVHQRGQEVQRAVLVAASGLAKSTAHDRLSRSRSSLIEATREAIGATPTPIRPAWPIHDPLEMTSPRWNRWKVRSVLAACLESDQPPSAVACHYGITLDQLNRMVKTAADLGPLFGEPLRAVVPPTGELTCCPPRGRLNASQRSMADDLFDRVCKLWDRNARLARQGVRLHLQHYTKDVHDIAFTESGALGIYVEFLSSLQVDPAEMKVCLRRADKAEHELPMWAINRLGLYGSSLIWCIRPRSIESMNGYSRWLGLKMFDSSGQGCGIWLARTLMYAAVACESISAGRMSHD